MFFQNIYNKYLDSDILEKNEVAMSSLYGGGSYGATGTNNQLKGTGYKQVSLNQFTPEQMGLFKQLFGNIGPDSMTSKLASGDQSAFEQLEAPALKQFNQLQGGLASRFSGSGGLGGRRSSGFGNVMNQATSDFAQNLQSQRMNLQRQAQQDLHSMAMDLLGQRPYQQYLLEEPQEQQSSWWKNLIGGGLTTAGAVVGGIYGGLPGAKLGGSLGSSAAKGFLG